MFTLLPRLVTTPFDECDARCFSVYFLWFNFYYWRSRISTHIKFGIGKLVLDYRRYHTIPFRPRKFKLRWGA